MTAHARLATIQAALAAGQSRRGIARMLGISDRTVRNVLRTADPSPLSAPAAEILDYIPPGPDRVVPVPTRDEALTQGGSVHHHKAFIACPSCGHAAWRDAPGVDAWTCACGPGPRSCHYPGPYRIRPFPVMPPEAA
jgi:hypothetical protein